MEWILWMNERTNESVNQSIQKHLYSASQSEAHGILMNKIILK